MPIAQVQAPLLHVWPLGQVTPAHASVAPPPVLVVAPLPAVLTLPATLFEPANGLVPPTAVEPPLGTPVPPLDTELPALEVTLPAVPACAPPPVPTLPVPPVVLVSVGSVPTPLELQATSQSTRAGDCFNQE